MKLLLSIVDESTPTDTFSQGYADDSQVLIISESLHSLQLIANDVLQKIQDHSKIKKQLYASFKLTSHCLYQKLFDVPVKYF